MQIDALAVPPLNPTVGVVAIPKGQQTLTKDLYLHLLAARLKMMMAEEQPKAIQEALLQLGQHPAIGHLGQDPNEVADALLHHLSADKLGWEFPVQINPEKSPRAIKDYKAISLADWAAATSLALRP